MLTWEILHAIILSLFCHLTALYMQVMCEWSFLSFLLPVLDATHMSNMAIYSDTLHVLRARCTITGRHCCDITYCNKPMWADSVPYRGKSNVRKGRNSYHKAWGIPSEAKMAGPVSHMDGYYVISSCAVQNYNFLHIPIRFI